MEYNLLFTNRDGEEFEIKSPVPLSEVSEEQRREIDIQLNEAKPVDYWNGAMGALGKFGTGAAAMAHDTGNLIGGAVNYMTHGETGEDVKNPWIGSDPESGIAGGGDIYDYWEGDIPQHVKERFSYKLTQATSQLGAQLALEANPAGMAGKTVNTLALAGQGYASGMQEYYESQGVTEETATEEQRNEAQAIGAMRGIPSMILDKIGLRYLQKAIGSKGSVTKNLLTATGIDAASGATSQLIDNAIAIDISKYATGLAEGYDPDRELSEGVGEAAALEAVSSGMVGVGARRKAIQSEAIHGGLKAAEAALKAGKGIVNAVSKGKVKASELMSQTGQKIVEGLANDGVDITAPDKLAAEPVQPVQPEAPKLKPATTKIAKGRRKVVQALKPEIEGTANLGRKFLEALDVPVSGVKSVFKKAQESEGGDVVERAIRPLKDAIRAQNEAMGNAIEEFEFEAKLRTRDFLKSGIVGMNALSDIKKTSKADYDNISNALLDNDFDSVKEYFYKTNRAESWANIGESLKFIATEAKKRGADIGEIEKYFPRLVKDYEGLKDAMGSPLSKTQWGRIVDAATKKKGDTLTPFEESTLFENSLKSNLGVDALIKSPNFTKSRKFEAVPENLRKFYADPLEALDTYYRRMADRLTRIDYLGSVSELVEVQDNNMFDGVHTQAEVDQYIASGRVPSTKMKRIKKGRGKFAKVLAGEIEAGRINDSQVASIRDYMGARFSKKDPMLRMLRGAKSLTHLAFLSSPLTTIRQLGDLAYSIHKNGINDTLKAARKTEYTPEDAMIEIDNISHEFEGEGTIDGLQKTVNKVLKLTGFQALDAKAKGIFLTSTANSTKRLLNGPNTDKKRRFLLELNARFGDQTGPLVKDLKAGNKSDLVSEFLFYELMDVAPISQSNMPYYYNKSPNARMLYTLKSYTLTQFNYARKQAFEKMASGDKAKVKEGWKNFASLYIALAAANIPADMLQDFITGDDWDEGIDGMAIDNLWRVLGLNSYTGVIARREGLGSAVAGLTYDLPLVQMFDSVGKDVFNIAPPLISEESKSLKYIPIFGKIVYKRNQNNKD